MAKGCVIVEAPGLEEAKQHDSIMDIPLDCIIPFKRVYRDMENGGIKEVVV